MNDIIQSIKANLYERSVSPLGGAFVVSWCIWNFKILIVVLSSHELINKLELLNSMTKWQNGYYWNALIFPSLTTVILIFVYPYPAKWVFGYWRRRQQELKRVKQEIDDETPLTIEDSIKIRKKILNLEIENDKAIYDKDQEIENLNKKYSELLEKNNLLEKSISLKKNHNDRSKDQIPDEHTDVLELIAKLENKNSNDEKEILANTGFNRVKTMHVLDVLESSNLVDRRKSYEGNISYKLTAHGRALLIGKGRF